MFYPFKSFCSIPVNCRILKSKLLPQPSRWDPDPHRLQARRRPNSVKGWNRGRDRKVEFVVGPYWTSGKRIFPNSKRNIYLHVLGTLRLVNLITLTYIPLLSSRDHNLQWTWSHVPRSWFWSVFLSGEVLFGKGDLNLHHHYPGLSKRPLWTSPDLTLSWLFTPGLLSHKDKGCIRNKHYR